MMMMFECVLDCFEEKYSFGKQVAKPNKNQKLAGSFI